MKYHICVIVSHRRDLSLTASVWGGEGNMKQVRARTELGILASASLVNLCTDGLVRHSVIP